MFYNNVPTKTAGAGNEGGTKYSPAATKKFIFFQLRDGSARGSEGWILVEARGSFDAINTLVKIRRTVVPCRTESPT